ncbi:MAG: TetR/AcrR family transcriptional regulator [Oscillospiraceae bacterium]|nr:TetR/AcrR family transcriptional regulator [Oscillospiraceae bacterium]
MKTDNSPDTKKQAIINASASLLMQYGYDRTTYQMIADALGISKSVIAYHFGSKPLMISSIFEDYANDVQEYVRSTLKKGFNYYLFHCISHICLYREVLSSEAVRALFFHKEIASLWLQDKLCYIESVFRDITNDFKKDFTDNDIHFAAVMNQGAKQSLCSEYLRCPKTMSEEEYCYYNVYLLGLHSRLDESTIQKNIKSAYEFTDCHQLPKLDLLR